MYFGRFAQVLLPLNVNIIVDPPSPLSLVDQQTKQGNLLHCHQPHHLAAQVTWGNHKDQLREWAEQVVDQLFDILRTNIISTRWDFYSHVCIMYQVSFEHFFGFDKTFQIIFNSGGTSNPMNGKQTWSTIR